MRFIRPFLVVCSCVLSACATLPQPSPEDWNAAKAQRQALEHWNFSGRTAVAAANEGWTASMDWKQDGRSSQLRLYGPFGVGALRVTTDGESLDIETSKGEKLSGERAKALLEQTLGAELPLRPMRYWLLGVPEPEIAAFAQLDEQGRLARLSQSGWRIVYDRYDSYGGQWLPAQISVEQGDVKVKVVVNRWRLGE